jgi:hypothetical protein
MTNHCGTCTACCRVFDIPELAKPAGKWCEHCAIGRGCMIYEDRPPVCRTFECMWLLSQQRENPRERFKPELRPDKCKVVLSPSTNDNIIAATTMPGSPLAWRDGAVFDLIKIIASGNMAVVCGAPMSTERTMITPNGMRTVHLTEPDENGVQWNIPEGASNG